MQQCHIRTMNKYCYNLTEILGKLVTLCSQPNFKTGCSLALWAALINLKPVKFEFIANNANSLNKKSKHCISQRNSDLQNSVYVSVFMFLSKTFPKLI